MARFWNDLLSRVAERQKNADVFPVQLTGSIGAEASRVIATIEWDSLSLSDGFAYLLIKNFSKMHPVEVKFSATEGQFTVLPMGSIAVSRNDAAEVWYRSSAATATLEIVGTNMLPVGSSSHEELGYNFQHYPGIKVFAAFGHDGLIYVKHDSLSTFRLTENAFTTDVRTYVFDAEILDVFVTKAQSLLVYTGSLFNSVNNKLWRSTNGGVSWVDVTPAGNLYPWLPSCGIDQSALGVIMFGGYSPEKQLNDISIYRSADDGVNWAPTATFIAPWEIAHFHTVNHDPYIENVWYFSTGDRGAECRWYKSVDNGISFTEIARDPIYKTLGVVVLQDKTIHGTDQEHIENNIFISSKKDTQIVVPVANILGSVYGCVKVDDKIYAWTTEARDLINLNNKARSAEVWVSRNEGYSWQCILRWPLKTLARNGHHGFFTNYVVDRKGDLWLRSWKAGLIGEQYQENTICISAE